MIEDVIHGRKDPPVAYNDGDQSPVSGDEATMLSNKGLSYADNSPGQLPWMSELCRVLWYGYNRGLMEILKNKTSEEIKILMKKRESFALTGVVTHVVQGAHVFGYPNGPARFEVPAEENFEDLKEDFKQCLFSLLS